MEAVATESPNRKRPLDISNDEDPSQVKIPKIRSISQLHGTIKGIYTYSTTDMNFIFNINSKEEVIPAHKCILALRSPVFRQMFYGEDFLEKTGDVTIVDASIDEFVLFLRSFYGNQIEITEENIQGLIYLAHKYNMTACEEVCKHFLNETLNKNGMHAAIFWIMPLTSQYNYTFLYRKCIARVMASGVSLMRCNEFMNCSREALKEILSHKFFGRNENEVFERCIAWAKNACEKEQLDPTAENLRSQLDDCFDSIKFNEMSSKEFTKILSECVRIFTPDEIEQISKTIAARPNLPDVINSFRGQPAPAASPSQIPEVSTTKATGVYDCNISLAEMFDDNTTVDVFFTFTDAENQRLAGHKCILAAKSHTFEKLFMDLDETNTIPIQDASLQEFAVFLKSFYTKPTIENPTKELVDQVLALSVKFGGDEVHLEDCFVDAINDANVFWMLELSQTYELNRLYSVSCDHIKSASLAILTTDDFLNASRQVLKIIPDLHSKATNIQTLLICNAFIKWAEKFCEQNNMEKSDENLRTAFADAFESIPFVNMRPTDFAFFQHKYKGLFTDQEVRTIINEFTEKPLNRIYAHQSLVEKNDA